MSRRGRLNKALDERTVEAVTRVLGGEPMRAVSQDLGLCRCAIRRIVKQIRSGERVALIAKNN